jgi:phenylacetate-CoA ligase
MKYFNEEKECMEREALSQLQSERLVKIVKYTYDNVAFYRQRMD